MAGKSMIGLFIILLLLGCLSCGIFACLIYKIWMDRKRIIGKDMIRNRNAYKRSKKKKKKRKSSKSKKKKKKRSKKPAKRLHSKKRKKSKSSGKHKRKPVVKTNPIPQIVEPMNTHIEKKHPTESFAFIARRRTKSPLHCDNDNESYSAIRQMTNYVDSIKNLLPSDDNDMTKLSKYDYELNYDEEHLFRC